MASALYVGMVTDTGRFMYENTDAGTHRVTAALIEAGVDVDDTFRRLYEHVPLEKMQLVSRALDGIERALRRGAVGDLHHRCRLRGDRRRRGDDRGHHRPPPLGRRGQVAAVIRDLGSRGRQARKVSLRSTEGEVDVSAIARQGGGGHVRAAGFATDLRYEEIVGGRLRRGRSATRLSDGPRSTPVLLCDKPAGVTSHDVVAEIRRERGTKTGHAGTLDPFATGLLLVLLGRATRLQRYLLGLPKTYVATARLGWRSSTGDPDGELTQTGRIPATLELPVGSVRQRLPMTSAARVGGERLYRRPSGASRSRLPSARSRSTAPSCSTPTASGRGSRSSARPGRTCGP